MSNALAISAVTAVLQYFLNNQFGNINSVYGGPVTLSSKAPDLVQSDLVGNTSGQNQVNLFLHQVTYNSGWRNMDMPALKADGNTLASMPTMALDLHYLLTVYGSEDWQAEALLGYALLMLHQFPMLARSDISHALTNLASSNPLSGMLTSSGLADQIEMIKITPSTLGREEMAWLWTALKADYRPTFPFQVSVVLIQPDTSVALGVPVISRKITVQSQTPAQILQVSVPKGQSAAAPGDTVQVTGAFLHGATRVLLSNPRLGVQRVVTPASVTANSVSFVVPSDPIPPTPDNPSNFPAGIYDLGLRFTDGSGNILQSTASLPLAVAPVIQTVNSVSSTQITLVCTPYVMPVQSVFLSVLDISVPAQPFETNSNSLTFQFSPALPSGSRLIRLLVDGVGLVQIDWTAKPPVVTGTVVTI